MVAWSIDCVLLPNACAVRVTGSLGRAEETLPVSAVPPPYTMVDDAELSVIVGAAPCTTIVPECVFANESWYFTVPAPLNVCE